MSKVSKIFNKKELKNNRKNLRNNSTSAETALWNLLKNKQLDGRKFRRQHSINNFIVDFYCHTEKIIVELDGNLHGDYIQIERDAERDKSLEMGGFKVLRFENRFVFQEPEYILEEIRKHFR
jgi:very-short-patch-repair endonuclease